MIRLVFALIPQGLVRWVGAAMFVGGLWGIVVGCRRRRTLTAGVGALFATIGPVCLFRSFDYRNDGPSGWVDIEDLLSSTFGSWDWVGVFALISGVLWMLLGTTVARGWHARLMVAISLGSTAGAVTLGLLDRSIN